MAIRFGRYETIRTIASGGMATVYLGRAVGEGGFERLVAIKVMHAHIAKDDEFRSMFLDEARLAARIRHPNVVPVIDVQKTSDGMFLVMEYIDGRALHQLRRYFRKQGARLPIDIVIRIFVDLLTGLHAAHELTGSDNEPLNLVHRDVSPQNILVGKDGVSRITDFGVARAEARITSTRGSQLKGKIAYMSPEQVRSQALDCRSDVYAAGCALWEALAGKRLFRADSEAGVIHMILQGAQHGPGAINPEVPAEFDRVCMRSICVERRFRPPTAADFADELEAAARVSGVEIATHRRVAAFVKSLPEPKVEAQPTSDPSATTLRSDDPPEAAKVAAVAAEGASGEPQADNTTHGGVATTQAGSRRSVWLGLTAGAALLGGLVVYLAMSGSGPADPGAATTASPAATGGVETPLVPDGGDSQQVPAVDAAAPTAQASAVESAAPKASSPAKGTPKPRPPKKPGKHTGPGYNPKEL
ncbi:MAG: serine/threonine protein kinase [Deltaproteobacteria bacterium]|nr:serine/threonine protein kinase [Deltaproteobacteria bacterium]